MLMSVKKDIKKLPKLDLWIIFAIFLVPQREWISEWCVKNKHPFTNFDCVNHLAILGSFYRSKQNGCYGRNKPTNNFPQKMTISFMRLMLRLIITSTFHHFFSLISFEIPYGPKRLLNFGMLIDNSFPRLPKRRYETANASQKNILFSERSRCTIIYDATH